MVHKNERFITRLLVQYLPTIFSTNIIVIQTKFHLIILKLKMPNQFIHKIVVFPMHDFIASCKQRYKNFDGSLKIKKDIFPLNAL